MDDDHRLQKIRTITAITSLIIQIFLAILFTVAFVSHG